MNWLQQMLSRRRMTGDLSEEMQQHLDEKVEALVAGGMPREEAVHAARRAFGNAALLEQRSREVWMWPCVEDLWADVKFALRQLRKSPGFTATAIVTLGLGIGANTAIFSLFQQVLLRSLPVSYPEQLVALRATGGFSGIMSVDGNHTYYFSVPMFRELRARSGKAFSDMAASGPFFSPVQAGTGTETLVGNFVTGGYFAMLGMRPALGRLIGPMDDGGPGSSPVAVLSYGEWQKSFGGSPAVLGRTIDINAHPVTVIGVAAAGFAGLDRRMPAQIFVPMSMEPVLPTHDKSWLDRHDAIWINIVARLRPGMTAKRAEVELNPLWLALRKNELPLLSSHSQRFARSYLRTHLFLTNGAQGLPFLQEQLGPKVKVLMAMATMVLLISCVNLANLMLVRGTVRAKEIGVRAALGASRGRLMAWVLTEGLLLAWLGGMAGAGLGLLAEQPLTASLLGEGAKAAPLFSRLGTHLLLFAMFSMLLTGLLSCVPSMLLTTRPDLTRVLHEGTAQNSQGSGRLRLAFTTVQIALSFVLLVAACLLTRTLYNLRNVDLGIRPNHLLQFSTDIRSIGSKPEGAAQWMERIADSIRREPGVGSVGYASVGILTGDATGGNITVAGYKPKEDESDSPDSNGVSPDFFTAVGIPTMAGRVFTAGDVASAPKVAVVNDIFAKHYFGGPRQALGQEFCFGAGKGHVPDITIVGVVQTARSVSVERKPNATIYVPFAQSNRQRAFVYVRTLADPASVSTTIRRAVNRVDPALPVDDLGTMQEQIDGDIASPRLLAVLSIGFGLLAALLAAIGLYGVLAYSMAQRTREIGIRMALGADRFQVVRLAVGQVAGMALVAVVLGTPLGLLLSRYLRDELFRVPFDDPWSFAAAATVCFVSVAVAAYVPARRAASVDPMQALRAE